MRRHKARFAAPLLLIACLAAPAAGQPTAQPAVQPAAVPRTPVVQAPAQPQASTVPVQTSVTPPPAAAQPAAPVQARPLPARPANPTVVIVLILLLGALGLAFLWMIRKALERETSNWSLAEALSENEPTPFLDSSGNPLRENGTTGPLLMTTKLVSSTSRLIALMGLFGILLLYLGFGAVILYYYGTGQHLPDGTDEVQSFLLAGLTLFAPYVVNKFAEVFKSFARR
jgi:hypothetical protein